MKHWQSFLVYLAAFFLQPFLQNLVPVLDGNLNLILCLTVMVVFVSEDPSQGIFFGTVFSLLTDMFHSQYTGPGAVAIILCGIVVYFLKYFIHIENFFNALFFMAGATVLYGSVYWCIYAAIGTTYSYAYAVSSLLLQIVFNCIAGLCIYFVCIADLKKNRRDRYYL